MALSHDIVPWAYIGNQRKNNLNGIDGCTYTKYHIVFSKECVLIVKGIIVKGIIVIL
jgi:hypothetical protein